MTMIEVAKSQDITENAMHAVTAAGTKILLTRVEGRVCAFVNKCPHLGLSLEKGRIEGGVVTCPWHGSSFDVRSGENTDWCTGFVGKPMPGWTRKLIAMGKKPAPLNLVDAREEEGVVFVRPAG